MEIDKYLELKERLITFGYEHEIIWAETVGPVEEPMAFFFEYAWVVINSGMKNQVAEKIWERVKLALGKGLPVFSAFKHPGKASAIQEVFDNRHRLFGTYYEVPKNKRLDWLQTLPWIGPITKYHLAKNLGMDFCKPDRHLVRIAAKYELTPYHLCLSISRITGDRIGTVDLVIWQAANLGWI